MGVRWQNALRRLPSLDRGALCDQRDISVASLSGHERAPSQAASQTPVNRFRPSTRFGGDPRHRPKACVRSARQPVGAPSTANATPPPTPALGAKQVPPPPPVRLRRRTWSGGLLLTVAAPQAAKQGSAAGTPSGALTDRSTSAAEADPEDEDTRRGFTKDPFALGKVREDEAAAVGRGRAGPRSRCRSPRRMRTRPTRRKSACRRRPATVALPLCGVAH
jgi:hypothetical protein